MTIEPIVYVQILTALISVIGGIVAGGITGRYQARSEREKYMRDISNTFSTELRATIKELVTNVAGIAHSMVWLCWLAKFDSERFTWEQIVEYNQNVSNLLPKVLGLHTVIASMDYEVYDKLNPLIQRIFQVDSLIGSASVHFESGIPESIAPLAKEYEKAIALENDLSRQVANIIQSYAVVTKALVPSKLG